MVGTVEGVQRRLAGGLVGVAAHPDEPIRPVQVVEQADEADAGRFLGLDELALEQGDQFVAAAQLHRILAKFDGVKLHACLRKSMTQLVSQVAPSSNENRWVQRALSGVMSDQM